MQPLEKNTSNSEKLEAAFSVFNEVSTLLSENYKNLENKVVILNNQLQRSRELRYQELKEKERLSNRLSAIVESLPAGIITIDKVGKIMDFNEASEKMLGIKLTDKSWNDITSTVLANGRLSADDVILDNGRCVNLSFRDLGNAEKIVLISDVTRSKSMNESQKRHEKLAAMGSMVGSLAHQIRTPLSSALLYLSKLEVKGVSSSRGSYLLTKLRACLAGIDTTVNDLLLYTKGKILEVESVKALEFINNLKLSLEYDLKKYDAVLEISHDSACKEIFGNIAALEGALRNIIVNSMQSRANGIRVKIYIKRHHNRLIITIEDDGPGISEDRISEIFKPFYTTKMNGTGLGLAVSKSVIDMHNGTIEYQNDYDCGAKFMIVLPQDGSKQTLISRFLKAEDA